MPAKTMSEKYALKVPLGNLIIPGPVKPAGEPSKPELEIQLDFSTVKVKPSFEIEQEIPEPLLLYIRYFPSDNFKTLGIP